MKSSTLKIAKGITLSLINSPILTTVGEFNLTPCSLAQAKELINSVNSFESYIGHESTAKILTQLLGKKVEMRRLTYLQGYSKEIALVFKLNQRIPEGKILTEEEIKKIPYSFYILEKKDIYGLWAYTSKNLKSFDMRSLEYQIVIKGKSPSYYNTRFISWIAGEKEAEKIKKELTALSTWVEM